MKKTIKANILLNCIKTIMSIIFPLITFPYISRVLGTEEIGKINFGNSIVSYFVILASLGITTYSIREGSALKNQNNKRDKFFNEVFTINFISMIFAYSVLFIITLISVKLRNYSILLLVQSFVLLFNWIGVDWIYSIYEDYLLITIRTFIVQLLSLILMFVFVKSPNDYLIYALITVISSGGAYIFNYIYSKKYYRPHLVKKCNIKTHLKPMIVLAANLIAITIYVNADITLIGFLKTESDVGLYSTGVKVYTILKQVFSAIIISVTPRIAYLFLNNQMDNYSRLVNKIFRFLVLLVFPISIGVFCISKDIILLLAGEDYLNSVNVLRILSFSLIFAVFGSVFSSFGLILERKEKIMLRITLLSAIINIVLNIVCIPIWGINGAALTTLIAELLTCVCFYFKLQRRIINNEAKRSIISSIVSSFIIFIICWFCSLINNIMFRIITSVALSIISTIFIYIIRKEELAVEEIKIILAKIRRKI